jgi:uncharacterized protein (TIGR03437 family)
LSAASGSSTSAQITLTNNTANTIQFTIPTPTTNTGGNWLVATANSYTVTSLGFTTLTISVPNGLTLASGTYTGTVTITPYNGASSQIGVTFTVGSGTGTGILSANLSTISWSYTTNSGVYPTSQPVTLADLTGLTTYTANVASPSTWLYANGVYPTTSGYISSGLTISPAPAYMNALATGNYTGSVLVYDQNNNQVTITVNLVVNGGSTNGLTLSPNPLTLTAAVNGSTVSQAVSVSYITTGTIATAVTSGVGIYPVVSTYPLPGSVTVVGNPSGLAAGTYSDSLTVTVTPTNGGTVSQTIPVSFVVGSGGTTTTTSGLVAPTSLTFAYSTSSGVYPPAQKIVVTGTGTFTVGSPTYPPGQYVNWLTLTPGSTGSAPGTIQVSASPAGLAANTSPYTATVAVTPYSGAAAITVSVSFLVTASPVLITNPGSLNFTYGSDGTVPYSPVQLIASDGSAMPVTATTTTTWLTVSAPNPAITGTVVTVQGNNLSSLANGVYTGSVTVTATGAANSPVNVPVVLTVTGSTVVGSGNLTLGTLNTFSATQGGAAPGSQTLSVSASTSTYFTASASSTGNWLTISSTAGYTNTTITVSVIQSVLSTLTAGNYPGTITLSANGIQQTVNVTLAVSSSTSGGNVTVAPTSLSFGTYQIGGTAPANLGLQVASAAGSAPVAFTIASNATWLSAGVTNGTSLNTPANLTISAVNLGSLAAGPYNGTITITPNGGTVVTVPVSLTVTTAPTITVTSATTLAFSYQAGSANPSPATVTVSGGGAALGFSATVTSGSNWLSVTPTTGTTPTTGAAVLTVTATPGTLTAAQYIGTILVSGTGTAAGSTSINVTLTVTAPLPTINSVVNAASFINGPVSPGEIVTIFGTAMGPATAAYANVDPSTGKLATTIGGVQVLFNGIPGPMIYASATQISTIVPYEMAPISNPAVWIRYVGQTSNAYQLTSATTMPGLFAQNSQGSGPGAILNQDNSVNGPGNPAAKGSIVQVFMTGEGQTNPKGVTGAITTATLPPPQVTPAPLLAIGVLINGQPALYTYAGEAPGLAAGLMQLNVQIPINAQSGNLSITVSIGSNISQSTVTVSVR